MTTKDEVLRTVETLKMALKLALEALESDWDGCANSPKGEAITAIREALAEQPAPEPTTKQKVDAAVEQYAKTGNGRVLEAALRNIIINETLDKMAKNARELGLDYKPAQKDYKAFYDGKKWCSVEVEQPAQQEIEELTAQRDKLANILTRTANALKGQPAELSSHSWHDLPEVAQQIKAAHQQQEPVAYDKTKINCFAQDLYDQKMREGKRGHYESMFHVIHQCIKKVSQPASKPWQGLTDEERSDIINAAYDDHYNRRVSDTDLEIAKAVEFKLREKNEHREKSA